MKTNRLKTVTYEWDIETSDEHGDIQEHDHRDTLAERPRPLTKNDALVLVCDDDNGRSWAYVKNGELPDHFSDAYDRPTRNVPKRFHAELEKSIYSK